MNTPMIRDKLLRSCRSIIELCLLSKIKNRQFLKDQLSMIKEDIESIIVAIDKKE